MRATFHAATAAFLATTALATAARAQDTEAKGEAKGAVTATGPAVTVAPRAEVPVTDETPDHERFVRRFAVGYFGVTQLPIATGFGNVAPAPGGNGAPQTAVAPQAGSVNAPIIGGRYWLQRNMGIDAGLGFGMSGGSTENVNGNTTVDTDHTSLFGFALHGGVPFALAYGRHYTFEVIPEATLGFTSGTIKGAPGVNGQPGTPDTSLSGFRLDIGGRVGAEIHFGFMGIPELALQGSIGLYLRRESVKASAGGNSASDGTTTIATSVQSDPWALFVNNISALYYF
jgi:hypothetical protein